jgi:hypothetical protein
MATDVRGKPSSTGAARVRFTESLVGEVEIRVIVVVIIQSIAVHIS